MDAVTLRRAAGALILVALAVQPAAAQPLYDVSQQAQEEVVYGGFGYVSDTLGFNWDVNEYGAVGDGTNDCFDNGLVLSINGTTFTSQQNRRTSEGEYLLTANINGIEVTRRVRIDPQNALARYVEVFHNTTGGKVTLTAALVTDLGTACQQIVTNVGGAANPTALDKKDAGILCVHHPGRTSVAFALAAPRSRVKPTIAIQNLEYLTFGYALEIPAGRTVAIMHCVAQRNVPALPDRKGMATLFEPLTDRDVTKGLPRNVARAIVNWSVGGGGEEEIVAGPAIQGVLDLAEALDVERGATDVLYIDDEARLTGTVAGGDLTIETAHGATEVSLAEVALLVGGAGAERPMRVYLRNGEVLRGPVTADGLTLTTDVGLDMQLVPAQLNMLFLRAAADDGKPATETLAMLETHAGDCLTVVGGDPLAIEVVTAWGTLAFPLDRIESLVYVRDPQPGHRLTLADQSRLSVMLYGEALRVPTGRFGTIEISPHALAKLLRIIETKSGMGLPSVDDPADPIVAHCLLAGETILAGTFDGGELNVVTAAGVTPLRAEQILAIERADEDGLGGGTVFRFELADGGSLTGRLEKRQVAIRSGDLVWRVPAQQLLGYLAAQPEEPETDEAEGQSTEGQSGEAGAVGRDGPAIPNAPEDDDPFADEVESLSPPGADPFGQPPTVTPPTPTP